jgi:2-polyprenyl-3-methyl-5-hydroxy-6-metoxy-1,4-benzoquinol methylase
MVGNKAEFGYSKLFEEMIVRLHRGKERWPYYEHYIASHLGGQSSRLAEFTSVLCPEMEYHCGSLFTKKILDFGCGTGATTAGLAKTCRQVYAYDLDSDSLDICKQRVKEHSFEDRVSFYSGTLENLTTSLGPFDIILINGVIEHIPASKRDLRKTVLKHLFSLLSDSGCLFINDTPNRLSPFDWHTTHLWWIPWTTPGSEWAYKRAVSKGRHSDAPTISNGSLGLEEAGAWGSTYWEIRKCLEGCSFECVNMATGHNRHISYRNRGSAKRAWFEQVFYYVGVKSFGAPITAFAPSLTNLVMRKLPPQAG